MKVLLPPLLFAIIALGVGWGLGARSLTHDAAPASPPPAVAAASQENPLPVAGLARRAALLKKLERPGVAGIQRLLESGAVHGSTLYELAAQWAKQDPAAIWRWLNADASKRRSGFD